MATKPPPDKLYICSYPACDARYNKQWKLDAHLCRHTGVRPFACERSGCGRSFTSRSHLARHELTHSGERPFACTAADCADTFTTGANMRRHVARSHAAEPESEDAARRHRHYACDVADCGARPFKKHKQLKMHMCAEHAGLPPYRCTHEGCAMRFDCPSKRRRHEKVHGGYPCAEEACAFTAKTWTESLKHRREAHCRAHPCDRCDRVFRDTWSLRQHRRVHDDTRVVLRCPRDGCARSFTTVFNLRSHVDSVHEGLRPFACARDGCGKTFAARGSLTRHAARVHDHEPQRAAEGGRGRSRRPARSLASRLSGFNPRASSGRKTQEVEDDNNNNTTTTRSAARSQQQQQQQIQVVCLLQDAGLSSQTTVELGQ